MKEEFTTAMHEELLGQEMSHKDIMVMAVFACLKRGEDIEDACRKHGISAPFYRENWKRVIYS